MKRITGQIAPLLAEKFLQRLFRRIVQIDEDETFPNVDGDGWQALVFALQIIEGFSIRHAGQRAIERVGPAVEGAPEELTISTFLELNVIATMLTDVVKSAYDVVFASNDQNRHFESADFFDEEVTRTCDLFDPTDT